ncbi:NADH dehydrogenase ubiquinone 1 alpha subcomplex [Nesidiocoris tenuis]|uniref:NADH dehydrogenase [ubiquinone] 1 alpha subcomplex subunit 1 n=1 Tax=Nesidiocoris tenuis TaxID=355587 RepID=A0ABN7AM51_9HEMI|nr:NADH dehydrogenase ubiquinone 1 alpha subcomplex [Nesidiocoris tenuis]
MWYEILPCLGIITGALCLPPVINYQLQKWWQNGNPYRRYVLPAHNLNLLFRDTRLTGSPYKQQGLDAIPDS